MFHAVVVTFFVSMIPILELRGAIPMGVARGLSPLAAMIAAVAGNLVPVPFLLLFTRHVFQWLRTKKLVCSLVERLESRASDKSELVERYAEIGLCILVAIPLPGTGAWTGALVASMMNMRLRRAMPAISAGVLIAGLIITTLTYGAKHLLN